MIKPRTLISFYIAAALLTGMLLFLLPPEVVAGQKKSKKITITGTVTDADKIPIQNAIIMIDGEKTSSVTDAKGAYKVKISQTAVKIGIFTFTNGIREEEIAGRINIDFNFSSANSRPVALVPDQGEQAVDLGYSTSKEKNVTNSVDKIDGSNKKYASYSSIYDMIQREVSGVKITSSGIVVRNSQNLNGSIPALLIVDGVYVESISDIQPSSVESIEVLKDSAAAMYGSRGFGGVVIIKTKKGSSK